MIIAITGTPGTGKTSVAEKLSSFTGFELVKLNELAEKNDLYSGYDEKRKCKIVDLEAIKKAILKKKESGKNLIIESHYAQDIPSDMAVVLRANPEEIRKRGREKGWTRSKTEENVEAEIMEQCKIESLESGRTTYEADTTGKTPQETAEKILEILQGEGMFLKGDFKIPESLREKLREPYGRLFYDIKEAMEYNGGLDIISVGDFVSYSLYSINVKPKIFVVDGHVRRKPFDKKIPIDYAVLKAKNKAGWITKDLWMAAQSALGSKKPARVEVDGEEDMAVLPFMLMADYGFSVMYGLFDRGVCVIKVDESAKKTARNLLKKIVQTGSK